MPSVVGGVRAVEVASTDFYMLGEGPRWDSARQRLLWVDIVGCAVLEGALHGGAIEVVRRHDFECMVGAVAFADDGTLLVAAQEHLVVLHPDGSRHVGPRVVPPGTGRRMNDGAVDPAGRFLVGTLALGGGSRSEELVRLDDTGSLTVIDDDLALSNGLAWSTDGSRMYSVDSFGHTIFVRDYPDAGERRIHLAIEDGYPDGIAIDAEDHLWVAVWGAGSVRRFTPAGELVESVDVPAPHTSAVAFAGDDLRTLVITTARDELTERQLADFPDSGRIFTTRTDVPGIEPTPWKRV
jgi:sugar lactone lactonase YvrE